MLTESCNKSGLVKAIYILNLKDIVIENGVMVRVKRKYGKFKRPILKKEFNANS